MVKSENRMCPHSCPTIPNRLSALRLLVGKLLVRKLPAFTVMVRLSVWAMSALGSASQ